MLEAPEAELYGFHVMDEQGYPSIDVRKLPQHLVTAIEEFGKSKDTWSSWFRLRITLEAHADALAAAETGDILSAEALLDDELWQVPEPTFWDRYLDEHSAALV